MPRPSLSRLTRKLDRPKPPTFEQLIAPNEPAMAPERRLGYEAAAVLAQREHERREDIAAGRERARVEARKADDALWERIQARQRQAIG
jgi:hypothetical protein